MNLDDSERVVGKQELARNGLGGHQWRSPRNRLWGEMSGLLDIHFSMSEIA
jgi:hypothetical protein